MKKKTMKQQAKKASLTNVKSFSRIMTAFNEPDKPNNISNNQEIQTEKKEVSQNLPTFFIN